MAKLSVVCTLMSSLLLAGCVASRPPNVANVCDIFDERRNWYKAAKRTEERWGIPVSVTMAFVYQESGFNARAKPDRTRFLWIFPGPRPSSAYGYAQALDTTWNDYTSATGNWDAKRSNFADAADFIGWYNAMSNRVSRIAPFDAANLYFAYHEGNTGYSRGTHQSKPWLINTAYNVQANVDRFQSQYTSCQEELDKNWFLRLLS